MAEKQYVITDLQIDKIDLVDVPANSGARVVLFKRDSNSGDQDAAEFLCEPLLKDEHEEARSFDEALAETEARMKVWEIMDEVHPLVDALHSSLRSIYENEAGQPLKAKLKASVTQFVKEIKTRLSTIGKSSITASDIAKCQATLKNRKEGKPMPKQTIEDQLTSLMEKLDKQGTEFQKKLDTLTTENDELRKRLAGTPPEPDRTPLTKADLEALSATSREAVVKQATELKDAREQITKINSERALDREESRIEKKWPNISDEPREWAKLILKFDADSDERKRLEKMLEINNLKISGLTTPLGSDAGGNQDADEAYPQLVAKAVEIRKNNAKLSEAEALNLACEQNPGLYKIYQEEES